ncbi:hypothetical protein SDC9_123600 [bioreactor metagenome]|uniref:VTT domain-containing protein n=1 Tax=bioreactor metagenome TaxID=1076179 RepID=A0A645CI36_9ZZZZ|nr:TVP38/TMEM64 family protein [Oscillospiraceae bacterium]
MKNKTTDSSPKTLNVPRKTALIINIAALILFIGICVAVCICIYPYLKTYSENPELVAEYIRQNSFKGVLVLLGMQILQVVVAIIPGEILEIAAGVAFGPIFGLILAEIGVAAGSTIIFLLFKKLGKPLVYSMLGEEKLSKLEKFGGDIKRREKILFWLFFIPGLPKDLLTYVAPFTGFSLTRFLAITLIARIPSILTSTVAGDAVLSGNYATAAIIFAICGATAVIGWLLKEFIMKKLSKASGDQQQTEKARTENNNYKHK